MKNFGFAGETQIVAPGINGKIDEIRSAYGLLNLKAVDSAIEYRHQISKRYREGLGGIDGISYSLKCIIYVIIILIFLSL